MTSDVVGEGLEIGMVSVCCLSIISTNPMLNVNNAYIQTARMFRQCHWAIEE